MFVQKQKLVVTFGEELWQKLPPIGSTNCDGNDPQLGVAFIYRCRPKRQKVNMSGNYCNCDDSSDMDYDDAESKFLINLVIIKMILMILRPKMIAAADIDNHLQWSVRPLQRRLVLR